METVSLSALYLADVCVTALHKCQGFLRNVAADGVRRRGQYVKPLDADCFSLVLFRAASVTAHLCNDYNAMRLNVNHGSDNRVVYGRWKKPGEMSGDAFTCSSTAMVMRPLRNDNDGLHRWWPLVKEHTRWCPRPHPQWMAASFT